MPQPSEIAGQLFGKARGAAKAIIEGRGGIFRRLAEEHGEVNALMQRVMASSADSDARRELFPKIREELIAHAEAEQAEFYAKLNQFDKTRDLMPQSEDEHAEIERMLDELQASDSSQPIWMDTFKQLVHKVTTHVDREENEIFPRADEVLSEDQANDIEKRFDQAKIAKKAQLH